MPGHRHNKECAERKVQMKIAVDGVQNGTYMSVDHAVKALGVSRTTLRRRLKGGKTRKEAREPTQLLTVQEEKALADWITNATALGNPVTHSYIKEVAEGIRTSRADVVNEFLRPIGTSWLKVFLRRHPHYRPSCQRQWKWHASKTLPKNKSSISIEISAA